MYKIEERKNTPRQNDHDATVLRWTVVFPAHPPFMVGIQEGGPTRCGGPPPKTCMD